jgi:hypothetical protein
VGTASFLQLFSWQANASAKSVVNRLSDPIQHAMKNFSSADLKAITE